MARNDYIGLSCLVIFSCLLPFWIKNEYYLGVLVFAALNVITCTGLSLLMGYAGQISIGHGAFVAIGAYAAAILTTRLGWTPFAAMSAGVLASFAIALVVGIPTLRLKGHYLAMATLGIATIVHIVAVATVDLTGGPAGIVGIPRIGFFTIPLESDMAYYFLAWGVAAAGIFFAINLIHSRIGRGMAAIHGSEQGAASLGVPITLYKTLIFGLSAVYAAISGSLYAYYVNYIDPGPFDVGFSVLLVTMVAVGGFESIWGGVIGAVLLSLLPELLSLSSGSWANFGITYKPDYDILVYGAILLAIMLFMPEGLFFGLKSALQKLLKPFFTKRSRI